MVAMRLIVVPYAAFSDSDSMSRLTRFITSNSHVLTVEGLPARHRKAFRIRHALLRGLPAAALSLLRLPRWRSSAICIERWSSVGVTAK
jgi:hypothetical protein